MNPVKLLGLLLGLIGWALTGAQAASPPEQSRVVKSAGWRTDGSGRYPDATPPTEWSPTKNVIWSTPLPKWSNASPVLMKGLLYCCAEPSSLLCLNAADGKILWERTNTLEEVATPEQLAKLQEFKQKAVPLQQELGKLGGEKRNLSQQLEKAPGDVDLKKKLDATTAKEKEVTEQLHVLKPFLPPANTNQDNGYSSSTPVTDGEHVYAVFGTGVIACYDTKGNRVWARYLETPTLHWGHSASPVLAGGKLLVQINSLLALNPLTGETEWTAETPSGWGTAVEVKLGDTPALLTPKAALVRLRDGQLLASDMVPGAYKENSPIVHAGVAYYVSASGRKAIKLPDQATDQVMPLTLWQKGWKEWKKELRYWASPVFHDGLIYAVDSSQRNFSAIDAETGQIVYDHKLDIITGQFYSLTLAGKYLYLSNEKGTMLVIEPGREWKEIARNTLEPFRTSPIFDGQRMYLRTSQAMYCIGETP